MKDVYFYRVSYLFDGIMEGYEFSSLWAACYFAQKESEAEPGFEFIKIERFTKRTD